MQDRVTSFPEKFERAWLHRWTGLLAAWVIAVLGSGAIMTISDYYESTARVAVVYSYEGIPQSVKASQMEIFSDEVVKRIFADLEHNIDLDKPGGVQKARDILAGKVTLEGFDTDLFLIQCRDADPIQVRDICNAVLAAFEGRVQDNELKRSTVLQEESDELQAALRVAEQDLADFRRSNFSTLGQGDLDLRLENATAEHDTANSAYRAAVKKRDELRKIYLAGPDASANLARSSLPASAGDAEVQRLYTLYSSLENLRSMYSETHPDVVVVIREMQKMINQYPPDQRMCTRGVRSQPAVSESEMAMSVEPINVAVVAVVAANMIVCSADADLVQAQLEVSELSNARDIAQPVRQEFDRLEKIRDTLSVQLDTVNLELIDATRTDYSQLYIVVERPQLPTAPSNMDPRLLLLGALFAAIGVGGGLAYFMGAASQNFFSEADIEHTFALPLYGTVSHVNGGMVAGLDRSTKVLSFFGLAAVLIGFMVALVVLEPALSMAQGWIAEMLNIKSEFGEQLK